MKPPRFSHAAPLAFGACLALSTPLFAGTSLLVDDTFTGGVNADTTAYPRWLVDSTPSTFSSPADNLAIAAHASADGKGDNLTGRAFTETALGVGDMLTLSYDFTSDSSSTATSNLQRVGLYNLGTSFTDGSLGSTSTTKAGYYSFFANGTTAGGNAAVLRRESIASSLTTVAGVAANTLLDNVTSAESIGTTTRSVVFSVTNLGGGTTLVSSILYSAAGGGGTALYSLSANDTSGLTTFDSFFLLTPTGTTVTYDNIEVSISSSIPEPGASAALTGGAGLVIALAWQRRRRN